jgi:spermidine synthase
LKRAAFIGGGAFAMPEALLDAFPNARADVLEIDPQVIEVGRKYFRVDKFSRMHPIAEDARRFLRDTPEKYDFIFGDAYNGVRNIPAHLVTVEFFSLIKSRLSDDGIYMMNIISGLKGKNSIIFDSIYATLHEVFPHIYVFANSLDESGINIILVASARDLPIDSLAAEHIQRGGSLAALFKQYIPSQKMPTKSGPILRDDYNPIEYFIAKSISSEDY